MSEYSIWYRREQKDIKFNSFITDNNVEMFNITTIAKYFGYNNKYTVDWFNRNIDTLHIIDSIVTEGEIDDSEELRSISDDTIIKDEGQWYVNINVLIEYLNDISFPFLCELIRQMFDKIHGEKVFSVEICDSSTSDSEDE